MKEWIRVRCLLLLPPPTTDCSLLSDPSTHQGAVEAGGPVKGAWKKKKAKEVRVRREYRTAEQVLAEAAEYPLQVVRGEGLRRDEDY